MRLLKLKGDGGVSITKFRTNNVPAYAILSHTWGKDTDEVDYSDLVNGTHIRKAGYKKILFCGKQAERDGLLYFWVDSCCIDKTNNTELSEAIHSMFRWYQKAIKCYVYLIDVPARSKTPDWKAEFSQSRWFTRGWTLQELLAPRQVDFFSYDNQKLGSKRELEQHIHRITGIPTEALRGGHLSKFPVETRLSWAQNRNTTEEEDQAYCLLGIFDVSMPMIYGEGAKAWRRLLYEIGKLPDSGVGREPEMSIKEESEEGDSKGSKNSSTTPSADVQILAPIHLHYSILHPSVRTPVESRLRSDG
ncbi:HET-domain-containing protein [Mytilinidion resinicola]|uniref:HET-domain-containing protein n=1 Tax=Mytilinidion resinicola TaxID=574789 RepID=A0A6A6YU74_9PEZI|nr:HET-domain-containing protein [Mytilinidion resinicola]KAF2812310.1 HET-domain-containing protein [Mytilinidion resinicola]